MTQLGKVLVFVTVVLSFLMLGWSAALFTNRIDWTGKTAAKGEATPARWSISRRASRGRRRRPGPGTQSLERRPQGLQRPGSNGPRPACAVGDGARCRFRLVR